MIFTNKSLVKWLLITAGLLIIALFVPILLNYWGVTLQGVNEVRYRLDSISSFFEVMRIMLYAFLVFYVIPQKVTVEEVSKRRRAQWLAVFICCVNEFVFVQRVI